MGKQYGDLSDEQKLARDRHAQKRRERQWKDDLRLLMGKDWGRRIAYRLIYGDPSSDEPKEYMGRLTSSVFDSSIKDGFSCAILAARTEGARMFSMEFHQDIERVAPSSLVVMLEEQLRDRIVQLAVRDEDKK